MVTTTTIRAPSVDPQTSASFQTWVSQAAAFYDALRSNARIPDYDVDVVLAGDFVREVQAAFKGHDEDGIAQFSVERVGGTVAAKNIAQAPDYSKVTIVVDARPWEQLDYPGEEATRLFTVVHELAHPLLERARHASGAMDGVLLPSITGREVARSSSRINASEYWAGYLAAKWISEAVKITDDSGAPISYWTLVGQDYIDNTVRVLRDAHPKWPDLVQLYRERRMSLQELWFGIAQATDQTLTTVVHAQALADDPPGRDILALPEIQDLPAVRLYLGEPFARFIESVRKHPLFISLDTFKPFDDATTSVGEMAVLKIWQSLGLEIEEQPNRQFALWVTEPQR